MTPLVVALLAVATACVSLRSQQATAPDAEASCRVCHPGPTRGLADSPHAGLRERIDLRGKVCASCHGDLGAHAAGAGKGQPTPPVQPVDAATCKSCHAAQNWLPERASHALPRVGSGAPVPRLQEAERLRDLDRSTVSDNVLWSGFAELGYRFASNTGSRTGLRSELDVDSGVRLREFELRGNGGNAAAFDTFTLRGNSLGDPRWDSRLQWHKDGQIALDSSYRRDIHSYEAAGDYHRVDRDSRLWTTNLDLGPAELQAFASYTNRAEDGFWLTQRIGNRNLPVQTVVNGVASPRQRRADEGELGLRGTNGSLRWSLAAGFLDEHATDSWSYSQPATANPGFPESEDLTSTSQLSGPTARASLAYSTGPLQIEVSAQTRDLHRDLAANGSGAGYDTGAFTTTTTADGRGRGRLHMAELDASFDLCESLRLRFGGRYRDYEETLHLLQTDVRTTQSPSTATSVDTVLEDSTVQRLFDGDCELQWSPTTELDLGIGYGFAREQLRVPNLQPTDPLDFRRGHSNDDGLLANLRWRFATHWTLRAEGRDFATDGLPLYEVAAERARQAGGSVEWREDPVRITWFARHRHSDNDVSDHRLDALSTGINASLSTHSMTVSAGYTFATTDSRTRTNFYFDPDPQPQPTLVGFHGDTHVWNLSIVHNPCDRVEVELAGTLTRTVGSFAVTTSDLRAELRYRCTENGFAGVEWQRYRYADEGPGDDGGTDLIFLFWRQRW